MTATRYLVNVAIAVILGASLWAQTPTHVPAESGDPVSNEWAFSFNLSGYIVPHDRSYASPTFSAEKRHLYLGARYNYEDKETGSLWVGYNFEVGDKLVLEATPMIGGVFGKTAGVLPDTRRRSVGRGWNSLRKGNSYSI